MNLKKRLNTDEFDIFQNLFTRTQNMVRTQSKVKLNRSESDQLTGNYDGNQFW